MTTALDVIGPWPETVGHPVVAQVRLAVDRIAVEAQAIDVDGVSRGHTDALAYRGFFGANVSTSRGGAGAPASVGREIVELLAAASGAVWFVATQHRSPMEAALTTQNAALAERWAADLVSGRSLGAVAFAHLRRRGDPAVRATRVPGGWQISGSLDWVTSWGIADVLLLMAQTDDGNVVQVLIPAVERPGLVVTGPLALAAMSATSTVGVWLDKVVVNDDEVAALVPRDDWLAVDAQRTANTSPAIFGLMRAALGDLNRLGVERSQRAAVAAAQAFADQVIPLRERVYGLIDGVAPEEALDERVRLRAHSLELLQRVTAARVTAQGGAAMMLLSPAQRWAREAMFHLVQAQTQPLREALLADLATMDERRHR
ncbi:MAG: acyl-CoA dehydrogenase family protein [Actinomycetes bacterium]